MDEKSEAFGDPRFIGPNLLPTPESQRHLAPRPAMALWASLVLHPWVVDHSVARGVLDPRSLLPALGGSAIVGLLGVSLLRAPQRYGLGFVATARAAYGVRGAALPAAVRWIAAVIWSAAWVHYISVWSARLLLATLERFVQRNIPLPELDVLVVCMAGVWVAAAYAAARHPVERHAVRAPLRLVLALSLGLTLVALSVYQLGELPRVGWSRIGSGWEYLARQGLALGLATLPVLGSFTEWARRRKRGGVDRETGRRLDRRHRVLTPFVLVPAAVCFAALGALIHAAGTRASGLAPRGLVGSASAFGGVLSGVGALLFVLVLFFAVVPFAGVAAPSGALHSGGRKARRTTAFVVFVLSPMVDSTAAMVFAGGLLLPVVIVLVADELVIRRGRIELEELYRAPSRYGPLLGVGGAAYFATGAGWTVFLATWEGLAFGGFPADPVQHLRSLLQGGPLEIAILSAVATGASYVVLRVVEQCLPQWPSPRLRSPGPERIERSALPVLRDSQHVDHLADDKWPDAGGESDDINWFDEGDNHSNPSITHVGKPYFTKKTSEK